MADIALAVTSLGLTACQGLLTVLTAWIDYGKDIRQTRQQVEALNNLLAALHLTLQNPSPMPTALVYDCIIRCRGGLRELEERANELGSARRHVIPHLMYPFTRSSLKALRGLTRQLQGELGLAIQATILWVNDGPRVHKY